ncbi:MAG: helix-turn-helix domain-containing protein [Clostridiales bacterium]|nr:helix-turn-helix domain-containing protein [Clostridiales bacterium]
MKLGEKIWRLREIHHLSQEELAEQLEVTRQTVSNWENDKAVLDAEKLAKLCAIFGVSADDMLNGEGIPQPLTKHKETPASKKKTNKLLIATVFAITALALIVIATIGLIVVDDKDSISSVITLHSNFIWIALLVVGIAILISAVITFVKKK